MFRKNKIPRILMTARQRRRVFIRKTIIFPRFRLRTLPFRRKRAENLPFACGGRKKNFLRKAQWRKNNNVIFFTQ